MVVAMELSEIVADFGLSSHHRVEKLRENQTQWLLRIICFSELTWHFFDLRARSLSIATELRIVPFYL